MRVGMEELFKLLFLIKIIFYYQNNMQFAFENKFY